MESTHHWEPWNKGKLVGQKPPLKPKDIWAIRIQLQNAHQVRDLAMFNLAIDSKLRGTTGSGHAHCGLKQWEFARRRAPAHNSDSPERPDRSPRLRCAPTWRTMAHQIDDSRDTIMTIMTIVHWRHLLRQCSSNMRIDREAATSIIALELRMEGFRGVKPSECRPAVLEIARIQRGAIAFHNCLANAVAPTDGRCQT